MVGSVFANAVTAVFANAATAVFANAVLVEFIPDGNIPILLFLSSVI